MWPKAVYGVWGGHRLWYAGARVPPRTGSCGTNTKNKHLFDSAAHLRSLFVVKMRLITINFFGRFLKRWQTAHRYFHLSRNEQMFKNTINKYRKYSNISAFIRNEGLYCRYLHQTGFGAASPRGMGSGRRRRRLEGGAIGPSQIMDL